jgi:hypothetical protein
MQFDLTAINKESLVGIVWVDNQYEKLDRDQQFSLL